MNYEQMLLEKLTRLLQTWYEDMMASGGSVQLINSINSLAQQFPSYSVATQEDLKEIKAGLESLSYSLKGVSIQQQEMAKQLNQQQTLLQGNYSKPGMPNNDQISLSDVVAFLCSGPNPKAKLYFDQVLKQPASQHHL